jgi:hypothetical protein
MEGDEQAVAEMVTKRFDEDEQIKVLVSEMGSVGRNLGSAQKDRSNEKGVLILGSTKL